MKKKRKKEEKRKKEKIKNVPETWWSGKNEYSFETLTIRINVLLL